MFQLYRVKGPSMTPTLSAGDVLLLRRRQAVKGDVVVVSHDRYGTIVKRIDDDGNLSGDGPESTSEDDLGRYETATLIGIAVLAITPSGLRRLSVRRSGNHVSN